MSEYTLTVTPDKTQAETELMHNLFTGQVYYTDIEDMDGIETWTFNKNLTIIKDVNLIKLAGAISICDIFITNDTGPAHMAAHLDAKGLTLFGKHTTAFKVSIERENFKAIQVSDLNKLSANKVFEKIEEKIN